MRTEKNEVFSEFGTLCQKVGIDRRLYAFHPKFQTKIEYDPDEIYEAVHKYIESCDESEEMEIYKMLGDPSKTLCQCLWYLMEKRRWTYPATFTNYTALNSNYHGKIKRDDYNNMGTEVLMAICVGLGLNLRITEKLFDKSENKLDYFHDPDKTYIHIMESIPKMSMTDFNSILAEFGIKQLGSEMKKIEK